MHARIAEAVGYECAYMSGANTAAHILGLPDAGLITMTEIIVENAKRMANCISIPLISDCDQGFGNAINVRRTVQEFIKAGGSVKGMVLTLDRFRSPAALGEPRVHPVFEGNSLEGARG